MEEAEGDPVRSLFVVLATVEGGPLADLPDAPTSLGRGVTIGPIGGPVARWREGFSTESREPEERAILETCNVALVVEKEVDEPFLATGGLEPAPGERTARDAMLAIWLVTRSALRIRRVVVLSERAEGRFFSDSYWSPGGEIGAGFSGPGWGMVFGAMEVSRVAAVAEGLEQISRGDELDSALTSLFDGITTQSSRLAHLSQWTALEALFGTTRGRLSKRLAERISGFARESLGTDYPSKQVGADYAQRCKLSHGAPIRHASREERAAMGAIAARVEDFLVLALTAISTESALLHELNSAGRDAYLEGRFPVDDSVCSYPHGPCAKESRGV